MKETLDGADLNKKGITMELTKPSTLTFSQELMLAMKAKQEKEEKQKELQDLAFLVKPQPFIDYSKVVELKAQNERT